MRWRTSFQVGQCNILVLLMVSVKSVMKNHNEGRKLSGGLYTSEVMLLLTEDTVLYLLKARTVETEKQPLLGIGPYTRIRGTRHVRCDVTIQ
jgi:hypothetical protein